MNVLFDMGDAVTLEYCVYLCVCLVSRRETDRQCVGGVSWFGTWPGVRPQERWWYREKETAETGPSCQLGSCAHLCNIAEVIYGVLGSFTTTTLFYGSH